MSGIEFNPNIKSTTNTNEALALASTGLTNAAKTSSFGSTNENSQVDASALGIDLSSYDIKIQNAEKEILTNKKDIDKYQQLIDEQTKAIENLTRMIEDKQSEKKKIQGEIDSLENNEENRSKIKGLQNQISGIDENISSLSSYLKSAKSTKAGYEKELNNAEKRLVAAEAKYDSAVLERAVKQKAAIAQAEAAKAAQSSLFAGGVKNTGASSGGTSQGGINLIKEFEGCILQAYRCPAGVATIGYGHTQGVSMGQSISEAQAEQLLKQDLAEFEGYVNQQAQAAGCKLNQSQFDALVSFTYNLGPGGLAESGIIEKIARGDIQGAKNTMLQYDHAGGAKLAGLTRRREAEAAML